MATDTFQLLSHSDDYVAVCMEHFIMLIKENLPYGHTIWVYNLYTEDWRKLCDLPEFETPYFQDPCAVALGPDVYLFGGKAVPYYTNSLLKLTKHPDRCFVMKKVTSGNSKLPSPRCGHTGWAFDEKLWIFGGHGPSGSSYLDDFGCFKNEGFYITTTNFSVLIPTLAMNGEIQNVLELCHHHVQDTLLPSTVIKSFYLEAMVLLITASVTFMN